MFVQWSYLTEGLELGAGTYADVFTGRWKRTDGSELAIAMKYLRDTDIPRTYTAEQAKERMEKRFHRELLIWQDLHHPNILQFLGYSVSPRTFQYIFISPLCQNGNLDDYMALHPDWTSLSAKERLELTLGVARGLEYLHCHPEKICHGDVKPNNVILGDDYTPRLCDFGLSDAMSGKTKQYRTSGKAPGSANYEPFETWYEGTRSLAGDIFALAGVVLMIMSSQAPFNTMKRDLIGILKLLPEEKPDPSDHPLFPLEDPLWLMMNQCWAKDPIARPVIADCIKAVLEALGRYSKIELGV